MHAVYYAGSGLVKQPGTDGRIALELQPLAWLRAQRLRGRQFTQIEVRPEIAEVVAVV
jgi:hypothetical protein